MFENFKKLWLNTEFSSFQTAAWVDCLSKVILIRRKPVISAVSLAAQN